MLNSLSQIKILIHFGINQSLHLLSGALIVLILSHFIIKIKTFNRKMQQLTFIKEIAAIWCENINLQEIKELLVKKIGIEMGADRCFIVEYDSESKKISEVREEYLSSPVIASIKGSLPFIQAARLTNICSRDKIINISDTKKHINKNLLKGTLIDSFYKKYKIKSALALPIKHSDKILGAIVFHYTEKTKSFSNNDILFIKDIINGIAIALYQNNLHKEEQKTREREKISINIINIIRSSLELDDILKNISVELMKLFDVQRVYIGKLDFKKKEPFAEIVSDDSIQKFSDFNEDIFHDIVDYWKNQIYTHKSTKAILEIENSDMPEKLKHIYQEAKVKSVIALPIKSKDEIWGGLFLSSINNYYNWKPKEIIFLEGIVTQLETAIRQSELFNSLSIANQRNRAILNNIPYMAWLKDTQSVLLAINNAYAQMCNDSIENIVGKTDFDYFPKEHADTYVEEDRLVMEKRTTIQTEDIILGPDGAKWHETSKSPVFDDKGNIIGTVGLSRDITERKEAEIKIKQAAERELILKEITEKIRSNLDIHKRKKDIVDSIGKFFNADRCLLIENDIISDKFLIIDEDSEYISSPDIKSYIGYDFENEKGAPQFKETHKNLNEVLIENADKFIKENQLENSPDARFLNESSTKSAFGISLYYEKTFLGVLALNFTKEIKKFSEEEKNLIRILAVQVANSLHQSRMYEQQKKATNKERILKDIISDIKLTRDLFQAYNKLLEKLALIFNLNRTLFLESSEISPEELEIKYEYIAPSGEPPTNNIIFPKVCVDEFLNLIHNLEPLILDDVSKCYPQETSGFFKKYKIQALMSFPLIKYNKETKVLGFIVLCSSNKRKWSNDEIELMKSISDSVVSVIWEIAKFVETEELRNSFVLTLAHDFQVPLIGERIALEYLLNNSEVDLQENKELIKEMFENNKNITALLDKSMDIYNYESGKKELNLNTYNLLDILKAAKILCKELSKQRKIKISLKKSKDNFFIEADKRELVKVFTIIVENAIEHSFEGKDVEISYRRKNNRVVISIKNQGNPIPVDIQEKIFNRYEMANAIERKIGAGTGLFLCKHIVMAHKGVIWFDTKEKNGATFYISLPIHFVENINASFVS